MKSIRLLLFCLMTLALQSVEATTLESKKYCFYRIIPYQLAEATVGNLAQVDLFQHRSKGALKDVPADSYMALKILDEKYCFLMKALPEDIQRYDKVLEKNLIAGNKDVDLNKKWPFPYQVMLVELLYLSEAPLNRKVKLPYDAQINSPIVLWSKNPKAPSLNIFLKVRMVALDVVEFQVWAHSINSKPIVKYISLNSSLHINDLKKMLDSSLPEVEKVCNDSQIKDENCYLSPHLYLK